jgi:hypothetical protein
MSTALDTLGEMGGGAFRYENCINLIKESQLSLNNVLLCDLESAVGSYKLRDRITVWTWGGGGGGGGGAIGIGKST